MSGKKESDKDGFDIFETALTGGSAIAGGAAALALRKAALRRAVKKYERKPDGYVSWDDFPDHYTASRRAAKKSTFAAATGATVGGTAGGYASTSMVDSKRKRRK